MDFFYIYFAGSKKTTSKMWTCKYCVFSCDKRGHLLKHYRLKHGSYARSQPFPCLYQECLCTFKSFNSLKIHLSRFHTISQEQQSVRPFQVKLRCQLCDFLEPCQDTEYFAHLRRRHLKDHQSVQCPFQGCSFESKVYSTFSSHKSKHHRNHNETMFKPELVVRIGSNENDDSIRDAQQCSHQMISEELDQDNVTDDVSGEASETEIQDLAQQLEHNLAALFLKMQTTLHIPETSVQEVIQQLCQIVHLSQPLLHKNVKAVLQKHFGHISESVVKDVVESVAENNILTKSCGKNGSLATSKRRASYVMSNFALVMPIEYVVEKGMKTVAYVPLLQMLQTLLSKKDILDKVMSQQEYNPHEYRTCQDGSSFRENALFNCDEFTIALGLYIDDFEVSNPLGTSKRKHKMCAVYWIIANLPGKYRSALNTIQLALLCNTETVKECGYDKVLYPLLCDLTSLEQHGVYIERLGKSVKGSVLFVAADNLGAHSLAGFFESFRVDKFCRFCMASRTDAQLQEVRTGAFQLREKAAHNRQVQETLQNPNAGRSTGVKGQCPLTSNLEYFHVIGGYPPDILHDVFEGIVPVELSLCIKDLVAKKYITLDMLNEAIKSFPYTFSDKTDKPQVISKSFSSSDTLGGNGHENWCLIRLLPLLIGHYIPSGDNTWEILMLLKDIVALVVAPHFTAESLYILDYKVAEHRELLQSVFPDFKLRPKHHYTEHYSHLIRVHGPLTEVWTMRFEGKHKFFKKVIRDAQNFKNVAMTLAVKHQKALCHQLDCSHFFKLGVEMTNVTSVLVATFPENIQVALSQKIPQTKAVLVASSVCINGIDYKSDMILSAGSCSGLPDFKQITHIVAVNTEVLFVCKVMTSWYSEHLRSYELCCPDTPSFCVLQLEDLNDILPLSAYSVQSKLMVTLKRFILC